MSQRTYRSSVFHHSPISLLRIATLIAALLMLSFNPSLAQQTPIRPPLPQRIVSLSNQSWFQLFNHLSAWTSSWLSLIHVVDSRPKEPFFFIWEPSLSKICSFLRLQFSHSDSRLLQANNFSSSFTLSDRSILLTDLLDLIHDQSTSVCPSNLLDSCVHHPIDLSPDSLFSSLSFSKSPLDKIMELLRMPSFPTPINGRYSLGLWVSPSHDSIYSNHNIECFVLVVTWQYSIAKVTCKISFPAVPLTRNRHEALWLFMLEYRSNSIQDMSSSTVISDSHSHRFDFATPTDLLDSSPMKNQGGVFLLALEVASHHMTLFDTVTSLNALRFEFPTPKTPSITFPGWYQIRMVFWHWNRDPVTWLHLRAFTADFYPDSSFPYQAVS